MIIISHPVHYFKAFYKFLLLVQLNRVDGKSYAFPCAFVMRRSCAGDKEMRQRIAGLVIFLQFNSADLMNVSFTLPEWQLGLPKQYNMLV